MRELISTHKLYFLTFALLGLVLRMVFIYCYPHYAGDSLLYADIARNWLHHGTYALTESGVPVPTLIRLPGYPAFLAAIFALGAKGGNMRPALLVQAFIDLAGCLVVAALALELFDRKAAMWAFAVAALCPFTANYVALPMPETLAIFFAALALLFAAKAERRMDSGQFSPRALTGCAASLAAGILLRPDSGILLAVILFYMLWRLFHKQDKKQVTAAAAMVAIVSLAPLLPWTVRNWHEFHVFQPLAPRYATAPDEYVALGFNRWTKTWLAEYASVEDIFWNVSTETPGDSIDAASLPKRAFDSAEEKSRTEQLFAEFNRTLILTPQTDAAFAELARERVAHAPFRYYVVLPMLRVADMWLRPRTEMLPVDQHWWTFDDPPESWFAIAYGALNLIVMAAAVAGAVRYRNVRLYGVLIAFVLLRSLFLSTLENPEPRYTLECFPVVLVFAGAACARCKPGSRINSMQRRRNAEETS